MLNGNSFVQIVLLASVVLVTSCGGDIAEVADDAIGGPGDPSGPETSPPNDPSGCASRAPDVSTGDGWRSTEASQSAFDTLRFEVMARPAAARVDGLVAIGGQEIRDFTDAAIAVRFAEDGYVDARDGAEYDRDLDFVYEPGSWYTIIVTADVGARTYDVEIGRCGESPSLLIGDAAFRSDASVSDQLTTWAVWSPEREGLGVSVPTWTASGSCAPATCESLGSECGQPSDGSGGARGRAGPRRASR